MKQITKIQALNIFHNEKWKRWTDYQKVKFQLYQDRLCMPYTEFRKALTVVFGRSIWSHELSSSNINSMIKEFEKKRKAPTFTEILELIPKDKAIVIGV